MIRFLHARARNLFAAVLVTIYTSPLSGTWWARLLREDIGAAGDVTQKEGASAAFTITLASLASSSTWTAGQESTAIASAEPAVDYLIGGKITTGTSPTVSTIINVYVYAAVNDTPTYPDVLDGTDSAETITSENVRNGAIRLGATIVIDVTSDRTYWIAPFSLAALFGGVIPTHWGLFVAHNTGVVLNATGDRKSV